MLCKSQTNKHGEIHSLLSWDCHQQLAPLLLHACVWLQLCGHSRAQRYNRTASVLSVQSKAKLTQTIEKELCLGHKSPSTHLLYATITLPDNFISDNCTKPTHLKPPKSDLVNAIRMYRDSLSVDERCLGYRQSFLFNATAMAILLNSDWLITNTLSRLETNLITGNLYWAFSFFFFPPFLFSQDNNYRADKWFEALPATFRTTTPTKKKWSD